ncbi:Ig-like domain-containing protein, partial [Aeromonas hydrophila]
MNFAFLTDKDAFYYFPLNEQENASMPIQAVEGARYVFAEQAESDIHQAISAERVDDDLYLRLRSEAEQSTTVQVKDFFLHQGSVHSLSQNGEYNLHLTADNSTPAGPVALGSESLGAQQAQPDAAHLKVIQHAMTFQALDELALKLSPVAEPSPHVADAEPLQMLAASEAFAAAHVTPSIIEFLDKVGVNQGSVKSGSVTDDKEPTLVGMGEPNSTLDIVLNGDVIDTVKVDGQGKWSYLCEALPEGGHLFYVQDKASGDMSKFAVLIIDTMAPKRSTITSITDDTSGRATIITSDGHTRDTTPTLFGTADANTLVIIYNHNVPIHSIYADLNGNWTWTPLSLPEGNYAFKVAAMDFSGNIGLASREDYRITIGDLVSIPAITSITDNIRAQQGSLANNAQTDDKQPTLSGTAEANARVEIFDKGAKLGETRADASGIWTFTPTQPLSEGTHTFTVCAISQTGKISEPSPAWNITVDVTVPSKPGTDGEGPGLHEIGGSDGPLKNGGTTNDNTPTFKGEGEPGDTIIIIDEKSGDVIGETKVDEKGNWELTPNPALKDGEHEIVVIIEDPAGNQSEKSDPIVIVVDTTAPDAPAIGGVVSDIGGKLVELVSGGATNDTTPTFKGTTEANARVDIFDNNVLIGSTVADSQGNWSFTPKALEEGDHSFTTRATDAAGNTSVASPAWNIEIDITVPSKPGTDGEGPGLHEIGGSDGPLKNGGTTND